MPKMQTGFQARVKFKLGAFTDEISQDLALACRVCGDFGVGGAEIRSVWDTPVQDLSDAQVRDIQRVVADHGMVVCSVASPFGKCDLDDPAQVARHMDILRRCSDIGLELGCRLVRGFAFWDRDQVPAKPWDAMAAAYEPAPGILDAKGTILGLENEAACYVGTARHLRTFLDRLACPRVKALWDPANHVHDPQGQDMPPYPDGYALIKADLVHVHMKDAARRADGGMSNAFMGTGICRWKDQLQAFKDDGYEGFVSLETHVNADQFPVELQSAYGQYLTGEGREGASKVCLAWVRDTLGELV